MDRCTLSRYCSVSFIPKNLHIEWYCCVNRISTDDDSFSSNNDIVNYINDYFWPRIQSCTIRLAYTLLNADRDHKSIRRQWILDVNL